MSAYRSKVSTFEGRCSLPRIAEAVEKIEISEDQYFHQKTTSLRIVAILLCTLFRPSHSEKRADNRPPSQIFEMLVRAAEILVPTTKRDFFNSFNHKQKFQSIKNCHITSLLSPRCGLIRAGASRVNIILVLPLKGYRGITFRLTENSDILQSSLGS